MKPTWFKKLFIAAAISVAYSQAAQAASHYFDYTFDGTNTFTNLSAAGETVAIGDTIQAAFNASGAGYWSAGAGTAIWTPQGFNESGQRIGDLTWTFYNNGVAVDSGSESGQASIWVHIPQAVGVGAAPIDFDQLVWTYTLNSSDASGNTLNGGDFGVGPSLLWNRGVTYTAAAPVPEPETYAMMLAGLGLLGLARRRKSLRA